MLSLGLVLEAEAGRMTERFDQVTALNHRLRERVAPLGVVLSRADSSPYILSLSFPGIPSEIILNAMSAKGCYFSAGSACSARSRHKSHVIAWLTEDEDLRNGAIRVSFSWQNTLEEIDRFGDELSLTLTQLRKVIR